MMAASATVALALAALVSGPAFAHSSRQHRPSTRHRSYLPADRAPTATPIKHLVIVFQENRSFDRYFGTYPQALNPPGEPRFVPAPGTPTVNGLTEALLTHNPNSANPVRLGPDVGNTCGSNHQYLAEQKSFDMA